jgi:hypothetical protein
MSYISPFTGDVIQPTDVSYQNFSITEDLVLAWPVNGNADGNYAARIMEITATAGLSVFMPPASQVSVGTDALIKNYGSNDFTVKDSDGGTIITISAGQSWYIYITDNSTEAGTWGNLTFGGGNSGANATALSGYGLLAISQTLNQSHPSQSLSNGYTFMASDRAQTKVWSGGSGSVTLPTAVSLGDNWFFLFKNDGTGSLTINTSGSDTLDYTASKLFQPDESAFIVCTGSKFVTVGYGQSSNFFLTTLVKSVTSGNYLLTAAEASNIIQEYVGNLTGDVTVTYPPVSQLYIISNQVTANGYDLTITTGAVGAATVTVPSGQQVTLICDGTNFLNANTVQAGTTTYALLNGSVSSPSLFFASEITTGMYRPGAGAIGFTVLGTDIFDITSTGISVNGTGTFTGGISGGLFS